MSFPFALMISLTHSLSKCHPNTHHVHTDQDSDSDSDLSLDEERSLSIPSSESEENVRLRGRFPRQFKRAAHSERLLTNPTNTAPKGKFLPPPRLWQGSAVPCGGMGEGLCLATASLPLTEEFSPSLAVCPSPDVDGNDLMSYWPALGECEVHPCSLQKWGSERKLGFDINKDAANNNQPDLALTSGDENSLTQTQRQRKGNSLRAAWPVPDGCGPEGSALHLFCHVLGEVYLP